MKIEEVELIGKHLIPIIKQCRAAEALCGQPELITPGRFAEQARKHFTGQRDS